MRQEIIQQIVIMATKIDNNETRELIEFYRLGLDSIIQGDYSIVCFDGKDSSWMDEGHLPSTEYIILIEKSGIMKYQKEIDSFFGVTSFASFDNKLYFGCGDKIPDTDEIPLDSANKGEGNNIGVGPSNHAVLPFYLDNLIYGEFFGAQYMPDYQRYEYNLDLSEEELLIYLGTYFPRSY